MQEPGPQPGTWEADFCGMNEMAQREALEREQEWNSEADFPSQLYPAECLRELSLPLCSGEKKDPSACLPLGSAESNGWRSGHHRKKSHLWSRNCVLGTEEDVSYTLVNIHNKPVR